MTLTEYYNFSEDANVSLKYTSFYDVESSDFPCPSDMSYAFSEQRNRYTLKYLNTSNVTNMTYTFSNCVNLPTIPQLDTSNVTTMYYMFNYCGKLITIPQIDTSNVTDMRNMFYECKSLTTIPQLDTSNVTNMSYMFYGCLNLPTIPQIDTSNVTNMNNMFYLFTGSNAKLKSLPPLDCSKVTSITGYFGNQNYPRTILTDVGGWINLKCNWNDGNGLVSCSNLTYESCINILNGLYDFTGNGETPTSSQGKLKVHQNFINAVGDEISIGTNKGWTITT